MYRLGKWFSPWPGKSMREAHAGVRSVRGQSSERGWVRLCTVQLSGCKWAPKTRGRSGGFKDCLFSPRWWSHHILGADRIQKDATQPAFLQLTLLSSSAVPTTTSHLHVRYPHPDTQARLRHLAGPRRREARVDVTAGDAESRRARKEQLSTSCTLQGHHRPPPASSVSSSGTGLKGLLKHRGCLNIESC